MQIMKKNAPCYSHNTEVFLTADGSGIETFHRVFGFHMINALYMMLTTWNTQELSHHSLSGTVVMFRMAYRHNRCLWQRGVGVMVWCRLVLSMTDWIQLMSRTQAWGGVPPGISCVSPWTSPPLAPEAFISVLLPVYCSLAGGSGWAQADGATSNAAQEAELGREQVGDL